MSKLSFRARALDVSKPMPIFMAEELPDLPDYSAINRAVPQMPSGMEKEEECEHHLQRAICTGLIIPTPEVTDVADADAYDKIYTLDYRLPRQLIHMQPFAMEQDIPDYDMDSEDERWVGMQSKKMDITALKFEEMMDRLEKGSGQTVLTVQEAKSLLKEDDDLTIAVYDYWLNKRLNTKRPLIPAVKTEHRPGLAAGNPYLAFQRRTEKMQTRKNRKNDEASYGKMLKLRRDLSRAVTLLELVKRREKTKREHLHLTVEVYEKRYQAGDLSGQMLAELSTLKAPRPAFAPLFANQFGANHHNWSNKVPNKDEAIPRKEKRQYKKRKHKAGGAAASCGGGRGQHHDGGGGYGSHHPSETLASSDDDAEHHRHHHHHHGGVQHRPLSAGEEEEEADPSEGPFAFRRNKSCNYHAPLPVGVGNWPWTGKEEGGLADRRYRYCLTSVATPRRRCVGLARRRIGRGGRVILDRAGDTLDDIFSALDFTVLDSSRERQPSYDPHADWLHFRPKTPPPSESDTPPLPDGPLSLDVEPEPGCPLFLPLDPMRDYPELLLPPWASSPPRPSNETGTAGCSRFLLGPSGDVRNNHVHRHLQQPPPPLVQRLHQPADPPPQPAMHRRGRRRAGGYRGGPPATARHPRAPPVYSNGGLDPSLIPNGPVLPAPPEYGSSSSHRCHVATNSWGATNHDAIVQPPSGAGFDLLTSQHRGSFRLNSGEEPTMDLLVDRGSVLDKVAANQVCVDKKQLVRKNNSLPMEVT